MSRPVKLTIQILVSGGIFALLLWQIDLQQTAEIIRDSELGATSSPPSSSSSAPPG